MTSPAGVALNKPAVTDDDTGTRSTFSVAELCVVLAIVVFLGAVGGLPFLWLQHNEKTFQVSVAEQIHTQYGVTVPAASVETLPREAGGTRAGVPIQVGGRTELCTVSVDVNKHSTVACGAATELPTVTGGR